MTHALSADPGRWRRRAVTIPAALLGAVVGAPLLVVLLPLALVADLLGRRRLAISRTALFLATWLVCEGVGLVGCGLVWLRADPAARRRGAERLKRWWTGAVAGAVQRLFRLRFVIEDAEVAWEGPLLLLVRHASLVDTAIPIFAVERPGRFRTRFVVKDGLKWMPFMDIVGHWLPNAFIQRGAGDSEAERLRRLAADLPDDGMIVIYPEGTRYTPEGRVRRLRQLARRRDPLLPEAAALQHAIPPRSRGVQAMLEAAPGVDVVFCAHHGLEGIRHLRDLLSGALVAQTVTVRFWRVSAADIPQGEDRRRAWLLAQWQVLDDWLDARSG